MFLVGRAGFEPATNGLKVHERQYLPTLIAADKINPNQQLASVALDACTVRALIDIPQNWGFLATWWLHGPAV